MSEAVPSNDLTQNIDRETGEPPELVVADSKSAFELCRQFIKDDEPRAMDRTRISGLLNGRRPYSREKLRSLGQAWRSNVDFGTAGSLVEEQHATFWDLITEVPYLMRFMVKRSAHQDPLMRRKWSELISMKVHEFILENWADYYVEMALLIDEMVRFGRSHVMFRDEDSWKFQSGKVNALLMPDGTTVRREDVAMIGLVDNMPAHELFNHLRNKHNGWDEETVREVLWASKDNGTNTDQYSPHDFEAWEQSLKNNDLHTSFVSCSKVAVYHLFAREYDGSITHMIVDAKQSRPNFLYHERGRFKSYEEIIFPVYRHYGDGFAHGVQGMGEKCFNLCELENRVMNSGADTLLMAGTVIIRNEGGDENTHGSKVLKWGPVTEMPPGYRVEANLIGQNTNYLFGGVRFLQRHLMDIANVSRPGTLDEDGAPPTATQVAVDSNDRANIRKSGVSFFYIQMDRIYKQMALRIFKSRGPEVQALKEELMDMGVPEEVLEKGMKHLRVRSARTLGSGSEIQRRRIAATAEKFIPFYDQAGRREAVRFNLAASGGGQDAVELFMPDEDRNRIPTTETTLIALENSHFTMGHTLPVGIDQDHVIHVQEHLPLLQQAAQAAQTQGSNLQAAYNVLSAGLPHVYQHAEFMAQNPVDENASRQIIAELQQLDNIAKQIEQQLGDQQQAQILAAQQAQEAQAGTANAEAQMKMAEIRANADAKFQADVYKENNLQQIRLMRERNKNQVRFAEAG